MKKILTLIITMLLPSTVLVWNTFAQSWFWDNSAVGWYQVPWTASVSQDNGDRLIDIIKNVINRVLGLLSLIALILCLRWWFQMLTAAWDDGKVKTWTKILKNAAIWLVIIWLSWLFVSLVFRIIKKFAWASGA